MKVIDNLWYKKHTLKMHGQSVMPLLILIVLSLALSACAPIAPGSQSISTRQAEVAKRGTQVMPFDLEQTTHVFTPRDDGGLQQVVAKEGADSEQIDLIRAHLLAEAENFRAGNFSDPSKIHGEEMPGLATLQAHNGRIEVHYSKLPDGAQLEYSTDDQQLIEALHLWFEAQVMDHGAHAQR